MPSKNKPTLNSGISLGEAATRFLSSTPSEQASLTQQEIFKFIRWYGEDRKIESLTGQEVANYTENFYASITQSDEHLKKVKQFLSYAHKAKLINTNLSAHIKIKKVASKSAPAAAVKSEEPVLLTRQGYEEIKARLAALKEERPKIADELRKAAADKDFRENAPLEAAREKQGHVEGQIKDLENTLKNARVIESPSETSVRITLGDVVLISDLASDEKINYMLVGAREANIKQGKISIVSPMGQALFNKEIGDILNVTTPSGILRYEIIKIVKD
ncbi:MAG: GreA/GreB family elongation factor [Dehalococcoidia bacterium]|jgi:transcription elongation factor GreA